MRLTLTPNQRRAMEEMENMLPRLYVSHPSTPLSGHGVDSGYLKTYDSPSPRGFADRTVAACLGQGIPVGDVELPRESGDAP